MNFDNVKRTWTYSGKGYSIELVNWRWESCDNSENWNIYVHFYATHIWYKDNYTKLNDVSFDVDIFPPMHGGITYFDKSNVITIGCDYQHYGDEFYATNTNPLYFKNDIQKLIDWCDSYGKGAVSEEVKPVQPVINGGASKAFSLEDMYDTLNLHEGVLD